MFIYPTSRSGKSFFRVAFPSFSYFLSLLNVFLTRFHRTFQCFRNSVVQFSKTDFRRRTQVALRTCDPFIIPLSFPFVNPFFKIFWKSFSWRPVCFCSSPLSEVPFREVPCYYTKFIPVCQGVFKIFFFFAFLSVFLWKRTPVLCIFTTSTKNPLKTRRNP